jgi:hypothetical protein
LRRHALAGFLLCAGLALAGCQSTQSRSAELESAAAKFADREGLEVKRSNPDIEVVDTQLLQSQYGVAVAVELRNEAGTGLQNVPISIDVAGANGKTVFENNAPGLETALVSVPVIETDQTVGWVNDQILATGKPKSVDVKVGAGEPLPAGLPEIEVSPPKLVVDPVSGIEATGTVLNKSEIVQETLVLYAIARRGGEIVAAGRGVIDRLKTNGKPANYHIFFIGNPKGTDVTVTAPPTTLQPGTTPGGIP